MKKHTQLFPLTAAVKNQLLALSKVIPEEVLNKESALWLSFVLHVGFEAGFRRQEINEARLAWFDLHGRRITVFPDSVRGGSRTIPMNEVLFEFLTDYPMTGARFVVTDFVSKNELRRCDYSPLFRCFIQWAGTVLNCDLSHVRTSTMRTTYACLLLDEKVSATQVAEWMGCPEELVREYSRGQQT